MPANPLQSVSQRFFDRVGAGFRIFKAEKAEKVKNKGKSQTF